MRVKVTEHLGDLQADCTRIAAEAPKKLNGIVRDGVKAGNTLAKDFARRSEGTHGKYYHRAFTTSMDRAGFVFGLGVYSGEYGPDASRPQGNMEFEYGSRNQKPHLDLNRSADIIGPSFAQEVRREVDGWFW